MTRLLLVFVAALGGALAAVAVMVSVPASAESPSVLLLHGWNGTASSWGTARAQYEASGYSVHAVPLPYSGGTAGDTDRNADYIEQYIAANGLASVKLDGHSLGGWLALTLALARREEAVSSVVLRDSWYGGFGCWVVPDLCSSSEAVAAVKNAPPSSVPILNLNSSTAALPQVDCLKTYNLGHNDFLSNSAVTAAAIGWPGTSPCASMPTATPTTTPAPCSWWDRLRGRC